MVVDDHLVWGVDVVAVFKDAAQHFAGDTIHSQAHGGLGKRAQNTRHGFINDVVHPGDEFLDQLAVVVSALVALGKGKISAGDRGLQVLE